MAPHATDVKFPRKHVILCCLVLDSFSTCTQFVICAAGIMTVFLGYGYTQELMFHIEGFKPYGFYLTFVQFVLYSIFSFVERKARKESGRTAPLRTHLLLSVLTVGTIGLSNASLGYLNYPTQVLFKCCKLIPVLLGGVLIQDDFLLLHRFCDPVFHLGCNAEFDPSCRVLGSESGGDLWLCRHIFTPGLFWRPVGSNAHQHIRCLYHRGCHHLPQGHIHNSLIHAVYQAILVPVRLVRRTGASGSVPSCLQQKASKNATTSPRQPGETIFMTMIAVADNQNI
ncbi:solute carrier family 35 member B1 isoform X2 [Dermacentor albipictus]|uniref:solute carrier family 35 member B1 isoform X2 n=1 Tax=Dermacentor albipictus TaxID=60249 RepID=UPI0031FD997C